MWLDSTLYCPSSKAALRMWNGVRNLGSGGFNHRICAMIGWNAQSGYFGNGAWWYCLDVAGYGPLQLYCRFLLWELIVHWPQRPCARTRRGSDITTATSKH